MVQKGENSAHLMFTGAQPEQSVGASCVSTDNFLNCIRILFSDVCALFQLTPANSVIIDNYKQEMAAAKQYLRQAMVVSLTDKPSTTDDKAGEDKDKFEPVCAKT